MSEKSKLNPNFSGSTLVSQDGNRWLVTLDFYVPFKATYLRWFRTERAARAGATKIQNKAFSAPTADEARRILNEWREEIRWC